MTVVYRNIEAERVRNGFKRVEMAEMLNVTIGTYENWLKGKTEIPGPKVSKISEIFKVSTDYLLKRYEVGDKKQM